MTCEWNDKIVAPPRRDTVDKQGSRPRPRHARSGLAISSRPNVRHSTCVSVLTLPCCSGATPAQELLLPLRSYSSCSDVRASVHDMAVGPFGSKCGLSTPHKTHRTLEKDRSTSQSVFFSFCRSPPRAAHERIDDSADARAMARSL